MNTVTLRNGDILKYDIDKDKVTLNGKDTLNWEPAFVQSGKSSDFFGFLNKNEKKIYDIYNNVSDIVDEDSISL